MRVVVVGATGNVGTSLVHRLAADPQIESILGLARRRPGLVVPKTEWAEADIAVDSLVDQFRGADAVVHLAWVIQPSHDVAALRRTNVDGSTRVFEAVGAAGVPALVYASSVGAYSRGPKDREVDESWPTEGIASSFYSRHKVEVERRLDEFERTHPAVRTVRLRPGLIFKREAASHVRRIFAGPLLPNALVRRGLTPVVPKIPRLAFQAVHAEDVAEAYRLAVTSDARGAFNVAADPVLDTRELARVLDAREVPMPAGVVRAATAVSWRLRLQPTPPGWFDLALGVPLLDSSRARTELGWEPTRTAVEALRDLLDGLRDAAGLDTPPLLKDAGGRFRQQELATRVGGKEEL